MWRQIPECVARAAQDDHVKIVVFRGESNVFSAGADISELASIVGVSKDSSSDKSGVQEDTTEDLTSIAEKSIADCPKPTIALIEGICFGGGVEIAAACDIRVASSSARFCIPAANLGLIYPYTALKRLVTVVGSTHAKFLLYTASTLTAPEAQRIGLVSQVFPTDHFDTEVYKLLKSLIHKSRFSLHGSKAIIDAVSNGHAYPEAIASMWASGERAGEDLAAGIRGFLTKERPDFTWSPH